MKDPDSFTPEQLHVDRLDLQDSFSLKDVEAAKELRITLGLDELPSEVLDYYLILFEDL